MNIDSIDIQILRRIILRDITQGLHDYRDDCIDCQIASKFHNTQIPEVADYCKNVFNSVMKTKNLVFLEDIFVIGFCLGFRYEHELKTKENN